MAGPKRLCPSCAETVPTVWVDDGGWKELRCGYCGLTLDRVTGGQEVADDAVGTGDRAPSAEATAQTLGNEELPPLIVIAEDSRLLRRIVVDHLGKRFPKAEILAGEDGREALTEITRALTKGERRGLAILDLQMPRLNGLGTAIGMRAVEDGLGRRGRIPVVFFSGVKVNDALKEAMAEANPAAYLHKTDDGDPDALLKRLEKVMGLMIRRAYESTPTP